METRPFIHKNFLLQTSEAERLYHEYAKDLPIIDYHCHLPPEQVACNTQFENMTQIWLAGDHYKWRAMRSNGVPERFCTGKGPGGNASDWEKFQKWAETVLCCLRNPLFHWTALELNRPFGITTLLSPDTAQEIWEQGNALLTKPEFTARGIMKQMKVECVCTTDDPADSLENHIKTAQDTSFNVKMLPTFRPDKAMAVDKPDVFAPWLARLEKSVGSAVQSLDQMLAALEKRYTFFHSVGCRLSDHGLYLFPAARITAAQAEEAFQLARSGKQVEPAVADGFARIVLLECCRMNHKLGWTQQFHFGAMRNNSSRMYAQLGPDTGFDSIADGTTGLAMSQFLDELDSTDQLTRTILYNLNPCQNELVATMLGNFQDGKTPGKIQMGSGWWFLDQKQGMENQLNALSSLGLLSRFVGMLTDSRSFLSYTRHEYFRRVLCNLLGNDMVSGIVLHDLDMVGKLVANVSYHNAHNYFRF